MISPPVDVGGGASAQTAAPAGGLGENDKLKISIIDNIEAIG